MKYTTAADHLHHHAAAALTTVALCLALGLGMSQNSQAQTTPVQWRTDVIAVQSQSVELVKLVPGGNAESIRLTGSNPSQLFDYGVKSDEIISSAALELDFTASPSLLPQISQLNVYLNGQLQSSNLLTKDSLGKASHLSLKLNPKAFKSQNQITVELVGHDRLVCENEASASIWLSIAPTSTIAVEKQLLHLSNDLSVFPKPFVDTVTTQAAVVPFVLSADATDTQKTAAAVLAGYFGAVSGWRGANFPVYRNEVPASRHFVIFATNENRPDFLKSMPAFKGPEIRIADAPNSQNQKMLVIGGATENDLLTAVQAVSDKSRILIGARHEVKDFKLADALPAYDAPNWTRVDEAVPLGALMQYPEQLTARGKTVTPVHVTMRLAPDLFIASGAKATVDVLYRYSKPEIGQTAQLRTSVNGFLADSENLSAEGGRGIKRVVLPVNTGALTTPGLKDGLSQTNDLSFEAYYRQAAPEGTPENCRAATLTSHQLQIEPSSMVQFKGLYHYATLPELALFTQGGFPFSKYADLSETALVVDENADTTQLTVMLNTVGRIAAATGAVPARVTVTHPGNGNAMRNKDLLAICAMPSSITQIGNDSVKKINTSVSDWIKGKPVEALKTQKTETQFQSAGFAAITSIASPIDNRRTLVALSAEGDDGASLLSTRISDPSDLNAFAGGTVFFSEDNTTSFPPESTYTVGDLPWFERIWLSLSDRPFLLVFFALIAALIAGAGMFFFMRRWIGQRGAGSAQ